MNNFMLINSETWMKKKFQNKKFMSPKLMIQEETKNLNIPVLLNRSRDNLRPSHKEISRSRGFTGKFSQPFQKGQPQVLVKPFQKREERKCFLHHFVRPGHRNMKTRRGPCKKKKCRLIFPTNTNSKSSEILTYKIYSYIERIRDLN